MSEKINLHRDTAEISDVPKQRGEAKQTPGKETTPSPPERKQDIENISRKVEASAKSGEELQQTTEANKSKRPNGKFAPGKQLRQNTLSHSLKKVRKDLKPYQRPFSKFIHNDVVEAVSEIGEKTIARPSGLLAGGVVSFLTSAAVLWICRYYGYEYNYYVGIASFAVGFIIGITAEFISKPLRRG